MTPASVENEGKRNADAALRVVKDWYGTGEVNLLAPNVEWRVLDSFPSGSVYRGREAVIDRFFPAVKARFTSYETCSATFMADGDTVISTGIYRLRGLSGADAEADFAHVWTVRDGRIATFRQIADTATISGTLG